MSSTDESLRRVLIVDDNEAMGGLLADAIRRLGFEADHAASGGAAFELLSRVAHGIVFADIQMAPMNGFEFAVLLKERHPDAILSFLSGELDPGAEAFAMQLGAFAYLRKPVRSEEIGSVIRRAIRRRERCRRAAIA